VGGAFSPRRAAAKRRPASLPPRPSSLPIRRRPPGPTAWRWGGWKWCLAPFSLAPFSSGRLRAELEMVPGTVFPLFSVFAGALAATAAAIGRARIAFRGYLRGWVGNGAWHRFPTVFRFRRRLGGDCGCHRRGEDRLPGAGGASRGPGPCSGDAFSPESSGIGRRGGYISRETDVFFRARRAQTGMRA